MPFKGRNPGWDSCGDPGIGIDPIKIGVRLAVGL